MGKLTEDEVKGLMRIIDLAGKKICIQPLISNDEIGYQCIIVVMSLYDDNDIASVLRKAGKDKMKRVQNQLIGLSHNTDDKLKNELINDLEADLETLDALNVLLDEEFSKNITGNKCRCFILSIRPDKRIELRRMDTDEYIDIKNINDLFDALKDVKYDFIY